MTGGRRVVIGVGNDYRRDDGVGPRLVAALTALPDLADVELFTSDGEPSRMLDLWSGAELAVVVDTLRAPGRPAGTWFEVDLGTAVLPEPAAAGTHGAGLGTAVRLGEVLDRLPRRLVVLVVCGAEFGFGVGLSAPVQAALVPVSERVRELVIHR
ncbi:hydrogenase maturation protease [Paractinoplanes rishiriensis]|uniref:Peptidase M52 n=1 Tax=Paractinoplanes rishiriensis TaxID=1050105 RepID=A0A919KAT1_9ACTN|nr:hydrogenase maturation protease [Actinoplanes rishiriensis]GIF02056.1 peptidase M52 [Actinoplanes rishiriensis]